MKLNSYSILRKPCITEKAASAGTVVFEVFPKATKPEIKEAVEAAFDVKVKAIRTMNCLGKMKRVKTSIGYRKAWKKAYVTLEDGKSINLVEGL